MTDWTSIEGWLDDDEAEALQKLAADKEVLEIGSYCGRSTVALCQVAKKVFALDWYRGDRDVGNKDTLHKFLENTATWRDKLVILVGKSEELGPKLSGPFDLVFVDASHRYEDVLHDSKLAMRVGKTVAWHDAIEKGVTKAMDELGVIPDGTAGRSLAWKHIA